MVKPNDHFGSTYTGWPKKNGKAYFRCFIRIICYFFLVIWIKHLFLNEMTQRSLNLDEYFWFYDQFKIHCHFQNLSLFLSWETEIYASIDFHKQIPGQDWACLFLYCPQTKACNPGKCLGDCFYCYYSFSLVCGLQVVDAWSGQKNSDCVAAVLMK